MTYFNKYNLRTNDMAIFNPLSIVICIHLTKFEFTAMDYCRVGFLRNLLR